MQYNEQHIRQLFEKAKPYLIEISEELGRGFNFKGSAISNEKKKDCSITIENDIRL